jgi:hypothetical protein
MEIEQKLVSGIEMELPVSKDQILTVSELLTNRFLRNRYTKPTPINPPNELVSQS